MPLLLRAAELWPEVEGASGRTIVHWTGGVMVGRADSRTVAGSLRSAQEWGLPHELLDAAGYPPPVSHHDPGAGRGCALRARRRAGDPRGVGGRAPRAGRAVRRRTALRGAGDKLAGDRRRGGPRQHGRGHVHGGPAGDLPRGVGCGAAGRSGRAVRRGAAGAVLVHPGWGRGPVPLGPAPDLHLGGRRRPPVLRLPLIRRPHRGPRRRGQGRVLPGRPALHAGDRRSPGPFGGNRGDAGVRRTADAGPARDLPDLRDLHVHEHTGRAFRDRTASRSRAGGRGLRLLRARVQVRARRRGDHRRPGHRRRTSHPIGPFDPRRLAPSAP